MAINKRRLILQVGLAHMLEIYDFTLFAVLLPVMVKYFFPMYMYNDAIILGYLAFCISFFISPIGSIFWGYLGDKFGSSAVLRFSLIIMSFPSIAISLLPTYADIGILSTVLLMILRVMQGISASGAIMGSKIFVFDKVDKNLYITSSAIISGFGAFGLLSAMISGYYAAKFDGAWRVPFFVGGIMILVVSMLRNLKQQVHHTPKHDVKLLSFYKILTKDMLVSRNAFVISGMLGMFSYFMHTFMINYQIVHLLRSLEDSYVSARFTLIGAILSTIAISIAYYKSMKSPVDGLKVAALIAAVLVPLLYVIMHHYRFEWVIRGGMFVMGVLLGSFAGLSSVVVIISFAKEMRCRGALIANSLGVSIFGGATPVMMSYFLSLHFAIPAFFMFFGFLSVFFSLSKNSLREKDITPDSDHASEVLS